MSDLIPVRFDRVSIHAGDDPIPAILDFPESATVTDLIVHVAGQLPRQTGDAIWAVQLHTHGPEPKTILLALIRIDYHPSRAASGGVAGRHDWFISYRMQETATLRDLAEWWTTSHLSVDAAPVGRWRTLGEVRTSKSYTETGPTAVRPAWGA
ncbi:hypothetical protein GPX89_24920 [Nocardia sp. ET3-3]|uniref:Uncharacterized protein n=1 Tax=Nocardia terrae TaxID=2675851 RepID=A0A7K1V214_9NOCA|nr:hypothetical protein [Nocardia terrae]MVU80479.1 hypothetical protein [Nocardia terrae]